MCATDGRDSASVNKVAGGASEANVVQSPGRLEENAAAADLELSAALLAELDVAVSRDAVRGARYDDSGMALLNN